MLTPACFIVFTLSPTVGTVWIDVPIAIMLSRVDFPLRAKGQRFRRCAGDEASSDAPARGRRACAR